MDSFFLAAAAVIVATTAIGLLRVLSGPTKADRMMASQLLGTGGVAALLLAETRARAAQLTSRWFSHCSRPSPGSPSSRRPPLRSVATRL
ncbi:hypothetical protein WOB59_04525 [Methylocystis sp. IM4]|uniref:hypothetical protein n=1 Tax=Methylocystis sp. IM4 TaxID=3136560 RepID=UPI00311A7A07